MAPSKVGWLTPFEPSYLLNRGLARIDQGHHRAVALVQGQRRGKSEQGAERMFTMLGDFGDHELVLAGMHENVLSQRYLDTHMQRTAQILDHLEVLLQQ